MLGSTIIANFGSSAIHVTSFGIRDTFKLAKAGYNALRARISDDMTFSEYVSKRVSSILRPFSYFTPFFHLSYYLLSSSIIAATVLHKNVLQETRSRRGCGGVTPRRIRRYSSRKLAADRISRCRRVYGEVVLPG